MLLSALIGLLIGVVLGRHFKVLVLAPTFALTLVLAFGSALVRPHTAWAIASSVLVVIVGLQIGYLLGIGVRYVRVLARANRLQSASVTSTLPPRRSAH